MNTRIFNYGVLLLIALVGLVAPGCSQEAKLARHLAKANEYFASGSYEKAELEYRNALQLSAQNQLAMKRLGIIYADQGRLARADYFLSQARRLNTNDLEVRVRLASVCLGTGRNQQAREEALYVLGRSVEYPEASQVLALSANTTNLLLDTRQRLQQIQ
jgi:Flp pilus assembly protein TadD